MTDMILFRFVFVILCAALLGGASYMAFYGYGSESTDTRHSIRSGSGGVAVMGGRVK